MTRSSIIIILCLSLAGCSQELKSEGSTVAAVSQVETGKSRNVQLEINGVEEIQIFERAIKDSVKVAGTVNVTDPMYTFQHNDDYYFLWITEESGSIMNKNDHDTLFELSSDSIDEVYRFVTNH